MLAGIIVCSDACFAGKREDETGPAIVQGLQMQGVSIHAVTILPNDADMLKDMIRMCDQDGCDVIFTAGGVGISPNSVAPEATEVVCDREIPGIPQAMRQGGHTGGDVSPFTCPAAKKARWKCCKASRTTTCVAYPEESVVL